MSITTFLVKSLNPRVVMGTPNWEVIPLVMIISIIIKPMHIFLEAIQIQICWSA